MLSNEWVRGRGAPGVGSGVRVHGADQATGSHGTVRNGMWLKTLFFGFLLNFFYLAITADLQEVIKTAPRGAFTPVSPLAYLLWNDRAVARPGS